MDKKQIQQIAIGWLFILIPILFIASLLTLSFVFDGFLGQLFSTMAAAFCTPLIMESCLFVLGVLTLFSFLAIRRAREGDEFVEMEIEEPSSDAKE